MTEILRGAHSGHFAAGMLLVSPCGAYAADPLPSWNDGATKQGLVEFVGRVTKEGGDDFVPVAERVAVKADWNAVLARP